MRLTIKNLIGREICHFATAGKQITSSYKTLYIQENHAEWRLRLPGDGWKSLLGCNRIFRRALRLDKCNVVPVAGGLVAVRGGKVYHYDQGRGELRQVLSLKNCANVLHQSIASIDGKVLYLGEYGRNPQRSPVSVYRSLDGGKHWEAVFAFPPGKARHVHACCHDPFEDRIWVFTGDFDNECHVLCADRDFEKTEWIGNGTQTYRACNAFFERDAVHWVMDSPLQECYHIRMDRSTRSIRRQSLFPGPVWYIKRLADGYYLAATAQEIGAGVRDRLAHVMVSRDLQTWEEVFGIPHDGWPKGYFKFGVIGFADGLQESRRFYLFAEALKGLDGKTAVCEIE